MLGVTEPRFFMRKMACTDLCPHKPYFYLLNFNIRINCVVVGVKISVNHFVDNFEADGFYSCFVNKNKVDSFLNFFGSEAVEGVAFVAVGSELSCILHVAADHCIVAIGILENVEIARADNGYAAE